MKTNISDSNFIEVNITRQILEEAKNRELFFRNKYGNKGTHRLDKSRQRLTGYLAEAAIQHIFNKDLEYSEDDKFDFIYLNKFTLDSKSQGCNSKPKINFVGTIYEEQKNRDVDLYIFSRVKNDFTKVWITGIISKLNYFKLAKLIPAGTQNNNFTYDNSRYELEYKNLYQPNFIFKNI